MNQKNSIYTFWKSPYLKEIEVTITNIGNFELQFDHTIFYPGGGGQLHDTGSLLFADSEYQIVDVYKNEDGIWHKIQKDKKFVFEIGANVLLKLNWERRYSFMRAHSSQHLLTHVLIEKYGCNTTKANFEEGRVEIEIDKKIAPSEVVEAFQETNKIIKQGDEVVSIIVDQQTYSQKYKPKIRGKTSNEETVRLIQLGKDNGYDIVGCGGIHVNNLSEIKGIVLDTVKGNLIKYYVDEYAFDFANKQRELMIELEDITEKRDEKLIEMISNKIQDVETLSQGNVRLLKMIFANIQSWGEEINGKHIAYLELEEIDRQIIQSAAKDLAEGSFLVLLGNNNILYLLSSIEELPTNEIVKMFEDRTGAKGGGSKVFSQISVKNIENPLDIVKEIIKEI